MAIMPYGIVHSRGLGKMGKGDEGTGIGIAVGTKRGYRIAVVKDFERI